jgi:hypothetical protein
MRLFAPNMSAVNAQQGLRIKSERMTSGMRNDRYGDWRQVVELSGIEPLTSSLRIQQVDSVRVKPKNTK